MQRRCCSLERSARTQAGRRVFLVSGGCATRHHLVRLELREMREPNAHWQAIFPVYRCMERDTERTYGCLRHDLSLEDLERLFGPLQECARPGVLRSWEPADQPDIGDRVRQAA